MRDSKKKVFYQFERFRIAGTDGWFKLGYCPWQNPFCEYGVSLTYENIELRKVITKRYCTYGCFSKEEKCPIEEK